MSFVALVRGASFFAGNRRSGSGACNRWRLSILLFPALFLVAHATIEAQTKVTVDLGTTINILTNTSIGLPASLGDGDLLKPATAPKARLAGVRVFRYPSGGLADRYHWSSNTVTKINGDAPWFSQDNNFGNFARSLDNLGTALILVNYGANPAGTDGADQAEAAAWVAYANGDATDPHSLPKGKNGEDWHTVGYWATIRSQDPLATDDGMNFLRIEHPKSFGIKQWQIGEQIFNNGFYGSQHVGAQDLHASLPAKGNGNREKNLNLGPGFYGARVAEFATAMKAVDPSIHIGATLMKPNGQSSDFDWNSKVLKAGCSAIDFVTVEYQPLSLAPPDWKTVNESDEISVSYSELAKILKPMLELYRDNCPRDHQPRIAFSPAAIPSWPGLEHPIYTALWVADIYSTLIETGTENVSWTDLHSSSMIPSDGKSPGPAFMGLEMLHIVARNPGDAFVKATSDDPTLAVHATHRRDGFLALMLVNEGPRSTGNVNVTILGGNIAATGRRIDYGQEQQKSGANVVQSEINGIGAKFSVSVPAYTITDILVPLAN